MKGSTRVKKRLGIIRNLLRYKNRLIKVERERALVQEQVNMVLSTYLALLVEARGEIRIPCAAVSASIGKYRAEIEKEGEDYLIRVVHSEGDCSDGKK